jgi:hypothetical protein
MIEAGLSKKTILGRIEHEIALLKVFRAIVIIVKEMKIDGAIVTRKATITNPAYIEKDPKDNSEKANKKHNYRTDLVLILPDRSCIILEAKNTTINHFGEAIEQVGIYAGAAKVAGEVWVGQQQMKVTNIHTAMIFAKGPDETATHSQNFIEAQQKILSDQIILLDDPNWIWNLLSLIRNKGLLNQESVSTTRSSGFPGLKKAEPANTTEEPVITVKPFNDTQKVFQEIVQKVLEGDSKYNPQSPLNSADKTDKHLETALNTIDAIPTELESRDRITLKDMFVTSLGLGRGYSIQQLERDGATKEVIVRVDPLFVYDQKLNDFMLLRRQESLLNNLFISKNQPLFEQTSQDQSNILKLLILLEESEGLNFADAEFSTTAEEIENTRKTFLTGDAIPSTDNILSLLGLYKNYKIGIKQNQKVFSPMISLPYINLNDLGAALHIMISIRIAKILEEYEVKDVILDVRSPSVVYSSQK